MESDDGSEFWLRGPGFETPEPILRAAAEFDQQEFNEALLESEDEGVF